MPEFNLRYAPHLGYLSPVPQFVQSVGSSDPYDHARFARDQGFAGLFHPWAGSAAPQQLDQFRKGLDEFQLEAGALAYAPFEEALKPFWVSKDGADRDSLMDLVTSSVALARTVGSRTIAVLVMAAEGVGTSAQLDNATDNLRRAADIAAREDVTLGIEPMIAVPGLLLQSAYSTAELISRVDHPAVGLIFDTGHVSAMDGDVLKAQRELEDVVCAYQLADMPGRVEPGSGSLDFVPLLARLMSQGHRGLVELEHGWSDDAAATEINGIERLRAIDARAAEQAFASHTGVRA